jgi:hypothetical protein
MANGMLQFAVVGQQQQSFAIGVQSTSWINAGNVQIISQ